MSLRTRIMEAPTVGAVEMLLLEGDTYTMASPRTRRQWEKAAKVRVQQLSKENTNV